MKLPPTILIQEDDFHNAWARAVRYLLRDGRKMTIGDASEPKPIRDICATIELTGDAIRQIEDRELHPQFPFRHVDQYCEEFTSFYMHHNIDAPENERFDYTYIERLARHAVPSEFNGMNAHINQITIMEFRLREQLESSISSNRSQAITWYPSEDGGVHPPNVIRAMPCLQRLWVRYLGDKGVEVHLTWRSRDLYTAWQVNIVAIIDMLNREVIRPNNCRIVKLVDYADSLHIYESDKDAAKQVKVVPTFRI